MPSIVPEGVIKHYRDTKSLVSVTRDSIDSASIQGFILDYNKLQNYKGLALWISESLMAVMILVLCLQHSDFVLEVT